MRINIDMAIPEETMRLAIALGQPIDYLNLSKHCYKCVRWGGINTVAELYKAVSSGRIYKVRGIGEKSLYEIEYLLNAYLKKAVET